MAEYAPTHGSVLILVALVGCGGVDEEAPESAAPSTEVCADGELTLPDGRCIRPGIPADGCAAGFVHDGESGCEPILPEEPCPPGLIAVPGDEQCRAVMPCGEGPWGDIPLDATTQFVDARYVGGASDGSADRPWTTIGAAVAAAPDNGLIAIGAGSYFEDVAVISKPLRLWGVCPGEVEIVGTGTSGCPGSVCFVRSHGAELHGVAVRGGQVGLWVRQSEQVLFDRVWVHETLLMGVAAQSTSGDNRALPTSFTMVDSLVEQSTDVGVQALGANVELDATAVRTTSAGASPFGGVLIASCPECFPAMRVSGAVRGSLVEDNEYAGMFVTGADAIVEATVLRGNLPAAQGFGRGLQVQHDGAEASRVEVQRSLIDDNHEVGIEIWGSDATVDRTVVRATQPGVGRAFGRGIDAQSCRAQEDCPRAIRSSAMVRASLLAQHHDAGMLVMESDAVVEDTIVRGTLPEAATQQSGVGIGVQGRCIVAPDGSVSCDPASIATVEVRRTLVEQNHMAGLKIDGSDALIEDSIVRMTLPRASDQVFGIGIVLNRSTTAVLRTSLVDQNRDTGVLVNGAEATIDAIWVRDTSSAGDGLFGDGITVSSHAGPSSMTLSQARIERSARAGVVSFGAHAALSFTVIECASVDLDVETHQGVEAVLEDRGDNSCGCPTANAPCKAVSAGLEPPEPPPID